MTEPFDLNELTENDRPGIRQPNWPAPINDAVAGTKPPANDPETHHPVLWCCYCGGRLSKRRFRNVNRCGHCRTNFVICYSRRLRKEPRSSK